MRRNSIHGESMSTRTMFGIDAGCVVGIDAGCVIGTLVLEGF